MAGVGTAVGHESSSAAPRTQAAVQARTTGRVQFLDLLRLIASIQMVHGHTMHALMDERLRHGPIFEAWTWGRGLTSVAFLLAAGLSFHLSTLARFEKHKGNPEAVRGRLRTSFKLIAIGYLLHIPAGAIGGTPDAVRAALQEFAIADVLQCIGLGILMLEGLTLVCRTPRQVVTVAGVLAVVTLGLAPLADAAPVDGWYRIFTNYLTHRGGSLFPLFPWSGYLFSGVVIAQIVVPRGIHTPPRYPFPRLLAIGLGLLAVAWVANAVPWTLRTDDTSWHSSPAFALTKLGATVLAVSVLALLGPRIRRLPSWTLALGGESLALYVFHLLVLYLGGVGLYHHYGRSLSLEASLTVAFVMVVVSVVAGLSWHRFKAWRATQRIRRRRAA